MNVLEDSEKSEKGDTLDILGEKMQVSLGRNFWQHNILENRRISYL